MKNYNLPVINSANQPLIFNVFEPETVQEAFNGLSVQINDNQGMVFFPIIDSGSPCIDSQWINTHNTPYAVDFVFMKWNGTIAEIKTIPALSYETHICPDAMCVIELKADTCKKMNIVVGDNAIHNRLYRLADNRLLFNEKPFITIKYNSYNQINKDDIVAFAFIYPEIIQIFTTTSAFYIDSVNYDENKVKHVFPLWEKAKRGELSPANIGSDWNMYHLPLGQLFIRHEYNKVFVSKFGSIKDIPNQWAKVLFAWLVQ